MSNESVLVNRIKREILKVYPLAWVFKVVGNPQQAGGVPDLLVGVEGRLVGLEVKCKRPGESEQAARNRATRLQLTQITELRDAGCAAEVVISPAEALAVIQQALENS